MPPKRTTNRQRRYAAFIESLGRSSNPGVTGTCKVAQANRPQYAESVVIRALGSIHPLPQGPVVPGTLLGPGGLNHGHAKRVTYKEAINRVLRQDGNSCVLAKLKAADFKKDTLKKVSDVIALVQKDLV